MKCKYCEVYINFLQFVNGMKMCHYCILAERKVLDEKMMANLETRDERREIEINKRRKYFENKK